MNNNLKEVHEKYESFFKEEICISQEKTSSWGLFKKIKISLSLFLYAFLIKDYYICYNFKNPKYYNSAKGAILTFFKKDICESSKLVKLTNTLMLSFIVASGMVMYVAALYFIPFYSLSSLLIAMSLVLGATASFLYLKNTRQFLFAAWFKAVKSIFKNQSILTYYHMKEEGLNIPVNQEKLSFLLNADIREKDNKIFVDMLVNNQFKYITLNDLNKVNIDYLWKRNDKLDRIFDETLEINSKIEKKEKLKTTLLKREDHKKATIILSTLN